MIFITRLISYNDYNSFSGCDVVVSAQMAPINDKSAMKMHVLGSLQTISYSTHQDRAPVRSIGNINAIDYVQGQRTIAGTMVFAMFHEHWMTPLLEELADHVSNTDIWSDELPALNLTITMANEYGYRSSMAIYGVKFIDDGGVMSINDLYTENTLQYVATGIQPLKSVGQYQHSYKTKVSPFKISKIPDYKRKFVWNGIKTYDKQWSAKYRDVVVDDVKFDPKTYSFYLSATLEPPINSYTFTVNDTIHRPPNSGDGSTGGDIIIDEDIHKPPGSEGGNIGGDITIDENVHKRENHDFIVKIFSNINHQDGIDNMTLVNVETNVKHVMEKDNVHDIWTVGAPEGTYDVEISDIYGNTFDKVWSINVSKDNNQPNVQVKKQDITNNDQYDKINISYNYHISSFSTEQDYPVVVEVGDTNAKIVLNNNHDYVSVTKLEKGNIDNFFEDTITNDTRDYKISSNTSIEQSNNKEITIEDLEPNNKYLVSSHDSKNNNKSNSVIIETFPHQKYLNDLLKEYVQNNSNLLINKNAINFDFDSNKYDYDNITDSVLDNKDSDIKTEIILYAIKLQNDLNNVYNDNGIRSGIEFNSYVTSSFNINEYIKMCSVFRKNKTKNYYIDKIDYTDEYQYVGKANTHYFLQPLLINNKKASRIDFVCFDEEQQDYLQVYDNLDKINSLSFLDDIDQYKKYNEELKTAIKASNNLTLYKNILSMPYAKLYNDTLFVDVDYANYNNSNKLYLCIATPQDAISHIPIRKVKFTSENNLQLNKYETSILKNKYYLIWIQDDNFNNISSPFILSTYDNDKDIHDYYRNECKKYLYDKYDLIDPELKHKQYFYNVIFALLSEDDIRYKDIDYYFLQTLLALYQDNLGVSNMDDIFFSISNVLFDNNYTNDVKVKLYDNTISIDANDGFNMHMSCINITQSDIIKNKLEHFYDIESYRDGYSILILTDESYRYRFGYILINNETKNIYTSNINLEVVKDGR